LAASAKEDRMPPSPRTRDDAAPANRAERARGWLRADIVLLAIGVLALVWLIGDVLLLIFAGILLAVAIDGVASPLAERSPLSRGWAIAVVLVGVVLLLALAGLLIVPQFLEQIGAIWDRLTELVAQFQQAMGRYPVLEQMFAGQEDDGVREIAGQLATATMTVLGALASLLIVVVIGLFLAADPGLYRRGVVRLVPHASRAKAEETLSTAAYALRWWLFGQLVSMLLLGVSTSIGLLVLGVDLWLGLGVLVALFTFVPFLGPILAGIPVVLIGFAEGMQTGLLVLAFYLILQNVEGNVLTPMIQHRAVELPPALLISTQVLFGTLFGAVGLILAAPLAAVGLVAVNLLYIEGVLGDRRATP
jgi:predicted PurR-regulated permease PerM